MATILPVYFPLFRICLSTTLSRNASKSIQTPPQMLCEASLHLKRQFRGKDLMLPGQRVTAVSLTDTAVMSELQGFIVWVGLRGQLVVDGGGGEVPMGERGVGGGGSSLPRYLWKQFCWLGKATPVVRCCACSQRMWIGPSKSPE